MQRVTVNHEYVFQPVGMDVFDPANTAVAGQTVRVVNLFGCPPANTMGHCHIVDAAQGDFLGLVMCNSLREVSHGNA